MQDNPNKRFHNKREVFSTYLSRAIELNVNLKAVGHD